MSAYNLGFQMFFQRFSLEDCPFASETDDFDSWYCGFLNAEIEWEGSCEGKV